MLAGVCVCVCAYVRACVCVCVCNKHRHRRTAVRLHQPFRIVKSMRSMHPASSDPDFSTKLSKQRSLFHSRTHSCTQPCTPSARQTSTHTAHCTPRSHCRLLSLTTATELTWLPTIVSVSSRDATLCAQVFHAPLHRKSPH